MNEEEKDKTTHFPASNCPFRKFSLRSGSVNSCHMPRRSSSTPGQTGPLSLECRSAIGVCSGWNDNCLTTIARRQTLVISILLRRRAGRGAVQLAVSVPCLVYVKP